MSKVTRKTLASYVALLGPTSLAADALRHYDKDPKNSKIEMHNNGFNIITKGKKNEHRTSY